MENINRNLNNEETVRREKYPNRFLPGQSGNPNSVGSVKKTPEQLDALMEIRGMASLAVSKLKAMLKSSKTPAAVKVKICEMILDRTYGKPEASVRVTNVQETVARSRTVINMLIGDVQAYMNGTGNAEAGLPEAEVPRLDPGREGIALDLPGNAPPAETGDQISAEGGVV